MVVASTACPLLKGRQEPLRKATPEKLFLLPEKLFLDFLPQVVIAAPIGDDGCPLWSLRLALRPRADRWREPEATRPADKDHSFRREKRDLVEIPALALSRPRN